MLTSSALVLLMIPGVGFFYSGLARRKSALSLIWLACMSICVVSFQWFFWGYSLTFSHTGSSYIGDLENFGFRNVLAAPSVGSPKIPDLLFAIYQYVKLRPCSHRILGAELFGSRLREFSCRII